ncbi:MAG: hypothetical protein RJB26_1392, partial [Pseudomonadota bacterium]
MVATPRSGSVVNVDSSPETLAPVTPFRLLGEDEAIIRRVVDRFYDLMDQEPAYALLRGMHAKDLGPMRDRLTWWLTTWLGGPPRYQEHTGGGVCITAAHKPFPIDADARDQWLHCMRRALVEAGTPDTVRQMVDGPLAGV